MDTPQDPKPPIARHVIWLVIFFAVTFSYAWSIHAKPGGWTEFIIEACFDIFWITLIVSGIWKLGRMLKDDRAKQLAERARLKAFNDDNPDISSKSK